MAQEDRRFVVDALHSIIECPKVPISLFRQGVHRNRMPSQVMLQNRSTLLLWRYNRKTQQWLLHVKTVELPSLLYGEETKAATPFAMLVVSTL